MVCVRVCVCARIFGCGFCLFSDGLMLIVKSQAEVDAATRSDMDFLEWVIVILNGVIFAIPILYSFMEDAYSALVDKLSSRKYTDIDHAQDPDVSPGPAEISSQMVCEELHLSSDLVFPVAQSVLNSKLSIDLYNSILM
jgi:hypothetical protein